RDPGQRARRRSPTDLQLGGAAGGGRPVGPRPPHPERGARRGAPGAGRQAAARARLSTPRPRTSSGRPESIIPGGRPRTETRNDPAGSDQEKEQGMPVSVTLPALGESVTEGTVTRWLKQVGDTAQADEPLLEVSTHKVATEIPAPASGVLTQITVGEDETVAVGAELGVISEEAEAAQPASPAQAPAAPEEPQPAPQAEQPAAAPAQPEPQAPAAPAPSGGGTSVTLPALGESVTEGTVTRWLKQVGDTVQADEPLLEVSTDKVDTEIPAPASGVLTQITVGEDETVAVGAELG